ncbi:hypothetical protein BGZ58_004408 [Dissophora ornata]|nr:hypothetical protein BGZ58_004408 [Dissophora ornata]
MIISTPKIDDMSDYSTLTMSNTLANAQITADYSFNKPALTSTHSLATSNTSSSSSSSSSSSPSSQPTENTLQPRHNLKRVSSLGEGYVSRVGFDTLGCDLTSEYAFTLQAKTDGWKRSKHSRTFLVGIDLNDYSAHALKWVMDNMVEDRDEIVALRVVPTELRDSLSKSGIPSLQGNESAARQEATKIMESIRERNVNNKEISIVVEYMVGNVRDTIQHMV